jgi:uncharacterized protein YsxB (DUF464 family)
VAVRSKAQVCYRLMAGIAGSNPTEGMDVLVCVCCLGSSLCEGLITRSEEPYGVCVCACVCVRARVCVCVCLRVCDLETSTMRRPKSALGCCVKEEKEQERMCIERMANTTGMRRASTSYQAHICSYAVLYFYLRAACFEYWLLISHPNFRGFPLCEC